MSIRHRHVNYIQTNRLEAVLAAGSSNSTDVKRMRCYDYNSDDDEGPSIDWENSSLFKIQIYAESKDNTYTTFLFWDSKKHLGVIGDLFKRALEHGFYKKDSKYELAYDEIDYVDIRSGRGGSRRYIQYKSDGKSIPFEQLKEQIDFEKLTNDIKMFARIETHSVSYNTVAKKTDLGYPAHKLMVEIEGRLTVSKQAMT